MSEMDFSARANGTRLHFTKKLQLGFVVLFLFFAGFTYSTLHSLFSINQTRVELNEHAGRALTLINGLRFNQAKEDSFAVRFILNKNARDYLELARARGAFDLIVNQLKESDGSAETAARIDEIQFLRQRKIADSAPALSMRKNGSSIASTLHYLKRFGNVDSREINEALDQLFSRELTTFGRQRSAVDATNDHLIRLQILIALLSGISFFAVFSLLNRLAQSEHTREGYQELLLTQTKRMALARQEAVETVSHDLKNPLTSIELSLSMMKRQWEHAHADFNPARQLEIALRSTAKMKDLIVSVLDQAKHDAGKVALTVETGELESVIEEVLFVLAPLIQQKSLQIQFLGEASPVQVEFDRKKMNQVIANLLGNAIKFSPPGGKIRIESEVGPEGVRVCIADEGPGIQKENLGHLFEKFWQESSTEKLGSGLGLTISKSILDAHGGRIWAESIYGRGSKFYFELPLGEAKKSAVPHPLPTA